jgi:hypothetical protein
MIINQLQKTVIANTNCQASSTPTAPTNQLKKKQLIAKWIVDQNNQLVATWVTKD